MKLFLRNLLNALIGPQYQPCCGQPPRPDYFANIGEIVDRGHFCWRKRAWFLALRDEGNCELMGHNR